MKVKGKTNSLGISMLVVMLLLSSGPSIAGVDLFSVRANGSVLLRLTDAMEMFTLQETGENQYEYSYTVDMEITTGTLEGVTNNVAIDGGDGDNNITVMGSYPRNLIIRGGSDADDVTLVGVEVGTSLAIRLQSGDNSVDAVGLQVDDDTVITTAGGEDEITLSSFTSGDRLTVRTGRGDDAVTMTEAVTLGGVTRISTNFGADELTIDDAMVNGSFNVSMGRDDDRVIITGSEFADLTTVHAGNEDDDVTVTGNSFEQRVAILGAGGTGDIYRDNGTNLFESDSVNTRFEFLTEAFVIGDTGPGGGIVFSVSVDGMSGLEAAREDQTSAIWCNSNTDIPEVENLGIDSIPDPNSGAENTPLIIATCGESSAARVAANYTWPNGQTDGFLPNRDELNLLFNQQTVVGGFAVDFYWSSSEFDSSLAWLQFFASGNQNLVDKDVTLRVRAVRAF